jgi:hypothetical protein
MKLLRILILLAFSFNLSAENNPQKYQADTVSIKQAIGKLRASDMALSKDIAALNNQVSASINSNNIVVKESRVLIEEVNKLIQVQSAQQKDLLDVMDQAKEIKESKADLTLSIASDEMAIEWNFWSAVIIAFGSFIIALGSFGITIVILKKTLTSETQKHTQALESNLNETKLLNRNQIDTQLDIAKQQNENVANDLQAQISISDNQLTTQLKSVSKQTEEAHLLKIDEFRQAWINTFREDISVLFKSFITLKDFYSIEEGFFIAWDILKRAERSKCNVYNELLELADQETNPTKRVQAKLRINLNENYIKSVEYSSNAREQFVQYKNEFREFNNLHATIIEQKTKVMLMFNPRGTPDEKDIVAKLDSIHQRLIPSQRTFMPQGDKDAVVEALKDLQPAIQDMLKIEWNRVKRAKFD